MINLEAEMKRLLFLLIFIALILSCTRAQQPVQQSTQQSAYDAAAEITFTFTRQSGSASNQYAIWIEDAQGQFVKTLYAARWTANGGWNRRPTSIPLWVKQSGLSAIPRELTDTVSGATPRTGELS